MRLARLQWLAVSWLLVSGCAHPAAVAASSSVATTPPTPTPATAATRYAEPNAWLCLPGRAGDPCQANLDSTELRADGSRVVIAEPPPKNAPPVDCFYIYPTVDDSDEPGNHSDFSHNERIVGATQAQVGHFRNVCQLYVPLYRQVTLGTYALAQDAFDKYITVAAGDIADAFRYYLSHYNHGRKVVLIGHSQGADMVARLLSQFFDNDPALRAQLLLALPIGGHITVPRGQLAGGTFAHLPLCSGAAETGCIVAYRSIVAGDPGPAREPIGPGQVSACVNPTALGVPAHPTVHTYLLLTDRLRRHLPHGDEITTPFISLRDYYRAECVAGQAGVVSLAMSVVGAAGDQRSNPIDFEGRLFRRELGLHIVDLQLAQGDLIEMVARRAGGENEAK